MKKLLLGVWCLLFGVFSIQATEIKEGTALKTAVAKKDAPVVSTSIKVHGHWRVEIVDKDGSTVSVSEFDNELISAWPFARMMGLTGGDYGSYGGWMVRLSNDTVQPCGSQGCTIRSSNTLCQSLFPINSTNLSVTVDESTHPLSSIFLSGSVVAERTTTIKYVHAFVKICEDTVLPSNCVNEAGDCEYYNFTLTTIPSPPAVQAGQLILVTVDISFS